MKNKIIIFIVAILVFSDVVINILIYTELNKVEEVIEKDTEEREAFDRKGIYIKTDYGFKHYSYLEIQYFENYAIIVIDISEDNTKIMRVPISDFYVVY